MRIIVSELLIIYLQITLEIVVFNIFYFNIDNVKKKIQLNIDKRFDSSQIKSSSSTDKSIFDLDNNRYTQLPFLFCIYTVEKREMEMVFKMQSHARYTSCSIDIAFYTCFYSALSFYTYARDRNALRCKDLYTDAFTP